MVKITHTRRRLQPFGRKGKNILMAVQIFGTQTRCILTKRRTFLFLRCLICVGELQKQHLHAYKWRTRADVVAEYVKWISSCVAADIPMATCL